MYFGSRTSAATAVSAGLKRSTWPTCSVTFFCLFRDSLLELRFFQTIFLPGRTKVTRCIPAASPILSIPVLLFVTVLVPITTE